MRNTSLFGSLRKEKWELVGDRDQFAADCKGGRLSKSILVLAVPHQLQGSGFRGYVDDPSYSRLVGDLIKGMDFVFEEAAGHRPSTAEDLATLLLGPGRYLDVDPPRDERPKYGIATNTGGGEPIDLYRSELGIPAATYEYALVEENIKREELWRRRVQTQEFNKGLAICGLAHSLSFAFGLKSVGITVEKSYNYIPYHKLCTRFHAS